MKDLSSLLVPLALAAAIVCLLTDDALGGDRCREECHDHAPRVSYLKSVGGDARGGAPPAWLYARPVPTPAVYYRSAPVVRYVYVPVPQPPKRPFGWPAYSNPLERPAYR